MNIDIKVDNNKIELFLKDKEELIDSVFWKEERNLSQKLLAEIDSLLKKNKLKPSGVKKMSVTTGISEKFTTVRIAKVVAKTFNFSNKNL